MLHIFVAILTDVFNHWFAQGVIPGSITKGVITLLKKEGSHVRGELDYYRLITLLNTELKILTRVLANCLQLVISDLIGPVQSYTVKGRSIQDNLHLVHQILERISIRSRIWCTKDAPKIWCTEDALINLDQSKAFDRMDHRFLAAVLETVGFEPVFREWISMLYRNPQAVVQVNGRCLGAFVNERSVRQGCPLSPLLNVLPLEPLLQRLRDERDGPALRGILQSGNVRAKISAFADDITDFVFRRRDILAVKEAVARYEKVAGAKVNFDKSEGMRLGAWRGSVPLPGPFRILGV